MEVSSGEGVRRGNEGMLIETEIKGVSPTVYIYRVVLQYRL